MTGALLAFTLMWAPAVAASGPEDYRTPFVDEIGLDDVLTGDYPHRLRPRDVIFPLVMYLQLGGNFDAEHGALFRRFQTRPAEDPGEKSPWRASWRFWDALRPHTQQPTSFSTYRHTSRVDVVETEDGERRTHTWELVYNCPKDAFLTAVETLQLRRARYGPSAELSRWIEAQVKVFLQCSGEVAFDPPAEPQPDWQPLEQHDRRYQIAATYFYAGRYLEAADRFANIGRTPESPWRDLGRYLVPRCLAREAIVNGNERARNLAMAINAFRELAKDPEFLASFPSIPGLIRHYEAQSDPTAITRDLERRVFERPASVTVQDLDDYRYLINQARLPPGAPRVPGEGATDYELWSWLATSSGGDPSMAVERWRTTATLPWLYAALSRANADLGPSTLEQLVEAADGLSADVPGYLNMLVERIRLLGLLDRVGDGLRLAEDALGTVSNRSSSNRIRLAAASIATNWVDFLHWVSLKPLVLPWSDDAVRRLPANVSRITSATALFPAEAANVLDNYFTPTIFMETIDSPGLSEYQRGRMAIAGWTKAMLADDLDSAVELAGRVRRHVPFLNHEFGRFEQAEDKHFEAARIIFDHPGISPWMWEGAGRVIWAGPNTRPAPDHVISHTRAGWWCAGWHEHYTEEPMLRHPRFGKLATQVDSDRDLAAIQSMRRDIQKTAATTSFGPHVIRYAKDNLDDPRVPRTLHRLVFATRYACRPAPGEISRAAFELLHANFPDTEWAAKTPYWYDGY